MLIQLPGGQWVNPTDVLAVTAVPGSAEDGRRAIARVSMNNGGWIDVLDNDYYNAEIMRDQIAEQVNAACYEAGR